MPNCEHCTIFNPPEEVLCTSCGAPLPSPSPIEAFWADLSTKVQVKITPLKEGEREPVSEENMTNGVKMYLRGMITGGVFKEETADILWTLYWLAREEDRKKGVNFNDLRFEDDAKSLSRALEWPLQKAYIKLNLSLDPNISPVERAEAKNAIEKLFVEDGPAHRIVKETLFNPRPWQR